MTASMSPVPYPPLQAGDDVDASFFDQLGDELDFPVSGVDPQRSQDAENIDLVATPEAGEHILGATGSFISKEALQGEDSVQEDSNAQLDFELDDAFSGLKIAEVNAPAKSSNTSADLHHLSNGDIQGENTELKSFSSSTSDAYCPNGDPQPDSSRSGFVQDNVDSSDSLGKGNIAPNSDPSEAIASFPPGSIANEMSGESISEEVKSSGVSKSHVPTVNVTEVQWSDFGPSAGFGSFSDLLSSFPADPSQQLAETHSSGTEFFQLTADPPLEYSSYSEQQVATAAVFDLHQVNSMTQTNAAEIPSDLRNPVQESQTSVFPSSEELNTSWQSQGQQQPYIQSDQVYQSEWQNPYPGWWYNVVTGEWLQESSSSNEAGGVLSLDTTGQYGSSGQTGNEQEYWQNQETVTAATEQTVYERGNNVTSLSSTGEYGSQWNGQNQGIGVPSGLVENPLFEESVVHEEDPSWQATGEAGAVQQSTSWEDQYPGWYYDYQAQEWKQTNPPAATGGYGASEASDVLQQSEPSHSGVERASSNVENQSQRYDSVGWSATEDHQGTSAVHYTQETPDGYGNTSNFSQFESISSSSGFPALSTSTTTVTEVDSRQWTETQSYAQSGQSSSYYPTPSFKQKGEVEQPQVLNDQYSLPPALYNMPQTDQQSASEQLPEALYNGYASSSAFASSYTHQIPQYETHDMRYNQFSGHQVPGFTAQTWPTVSHYPMQQHTGNSYQPQPHSAFDPMTPPKSVEEALRTSVGRPAHALTSFGFGGKLLIMKLRSPVSLHASDGTQSVSSGQVCAPGPIHVHSLSQLVAQSEDQGRPEPGKLYFSSLARQAFSGPLAGGSVSNKELSKWLDERSSNCRTEEPDCRNSASLSMLWGLLKVACQHYGKLRSAMGTTGLASQEEDGPEVALANLLTSGANSWSMGTFASTVCLQPVPSEHQLQATASEVKKLLVMGKRKEALNHALQGQLWGPALVLARQLGEKFYSDAVGQMAQCQFLPGSPLRTLSLLIAGQPADVFSEKAMPVAPGTNLMPNPATSGVASQDGLRSMLEEWQENLSIMAANRTSGDDRVISHLGDCLWKVKGEVAAAHICYLVADAVFEPYTSTSRLCLIGADHWNNPRTFATPEAIQRTEVYEYSKVLGNSQYTLVPFQPYKLIYASMLAEAGKTNEALRYCQAVLKTLKTASRAPEVETCRQAAVALEERLRIHTQGGHAGSLAPAKIVRNLFSVLDRGIHGIIGGPPQSSEQAQQSFRSDTVNGLQDPYSSNRVGVSPDRASATLVPSLSAEKLKDVKKSMPPRSISEPDFGSASMKGKSMETKTSGGAGGYLGRLSSSLFQKAGGIVGFRKKEAKLGEKNKFYYDEKLKKWVEEGVDPVEEAPLPPPPTAAKFAKKVEEPTPDTQTGLGDGAGPRVLSGTPPVPPSNQFSARTKQGVRSRYVDTFNKGGTAALPKPVTSSLLPALKPVGAPLQPMSFFVPGPSADSAKPENGVALINEENHTGSLPGIAFDTEERTDAGRSTSAQNSVQQNFVIGTPLHRVGSAENTPAVSGSDALEEETRRGRGMSNGGTGLSNGYHSRANSWGGYPSEFQSSQFVTDGSAPSTSFSGHNGFLDQSSTTPTPTVNSYFASPPTKVETFYSSAGNGPVDASLPTPPSIEPFTTSIASGVSDGRGGGPPPVSLAADDLQEVEF